MTVRKPKKNEKPSSYADYLGLIYTSKVSSDHKKALGQFFTPINMATFLASFAELNKQKIRILDPGCGIGILSCALAEFISVSKYKVIEIELVAFETDLKLISYSEKCFTYLQTWLKAKDIEFTYYLCANDFVLHNTLLLSNNTETNEKFDIIISNPPYFKLTSKSDIIISTRHIIQGQTNIYSIFLLIAAKLLDIQGKLIFITPRSFASGDYFKIFREHFFSMVQIKNLHLFQSRTKAFKRDKVLQENIIVVANQKKIKIAGQLDLPIDLDEYTEISTSETVEEINKIKKIYKFKDLVDLDSNQKILHIPISENDEKAIKLFKTWKHSLKDFDIKISTGPVVAHRSSVFLSQVDLNDKLPLIWLSNIEKMKFTWPLSGNNITGQKKHQYITYNNDSEAILIPNKNYVFLRRFSSKDDKSRLIASPYFFKTLLKYNKLGVENHVNYIYREKANLEKHVVIGLSILLNSKLFDIYFRTFNGNINVSATELRNMPMPEFDIIKKIGKIVDMDRLTDFEYINKIVENAFKIKF